MPHPELNSPEQPLAQLWWGLEGHNGEYVFKLKPYHLGPEIIIPHYWEQELQSVLGDDWFVKNRSTRLELVPPYRQRTAETDERVKQVLAEKAGEKYVFTFEIRRQRTNI